MLKRCSGHLSNMASARSRRDFLQLKRPASALGMASASGGAHSAADSSASTQPCASAGVHLAGETFTLAFADTGIVGRSLRKQLIADQRLDVRPEDLQRYVEDFSVDYLAAWTEVEDNQVVWKEHAHTEQEDIQLTSRRWATMHKLKRCTPV